MKRTADELDPPHYTVSVGSMEYQLADDCLDSIVNVQHRQLVRQFAIGLDEMATKMNELLTMGDPPMGTLKFDPPNPVAEELYGTLRRAFPYVTGGGALEVELNDPRDVKFFRPIRDILNDHQERRIKWQAGRKEILYIACQLTKHFVQLTMLDRETDHFQEYAKCIAESFQPDQFKQLLDRLVALRHECTTGIPEITINTNTV